MPYIWHSTRHSHIHSFTADLFTTGHVPGTAAIPISFSKFNGSTKVSLSPANENDAPQRQHSRDDRFTASTSATLPPASSEQMSRAIAYATATKWHSKTAGPVALPALRVGRDPRRAPAGPKRRQKHGPTAAAAENR